VLAALAFFCLSATGANSIVSERMGQTLEVLLTTPLSARQILREKERSLRRLEWILAVPLLTVFACKAYLISGSFSSSVERTSWFPYLTCAVLTLVIYLPMVTWLSLWIGMRVRTRFRAIMTSLGFLMFWIALCPLFFFIFGEHGNYALNLISLASPISAGVLNEFGELHKVWDTETAWPVIIANTTIYGLIAVILRDRVFADTDRWMRR